MNEMIETSMPGQVRRSIVAAIVRAHNWLQSETVSSNNSLGVTKSARGRPIPGSSMFTRICMHRHDFLIAANTLISCANMAVFYCTTLMRIQGQISSVQLKTLNRIKPISLSYLRICHNSQIRSQIY